MSQLPEGRKPLLWKDIPFADRPKAHPSTERLEIDKLRERVAELESRIAKADALAMCLQDTVAYFAEFDGLRKRAEETLAAYREGADI